MYNKQFDEVFPYFKNVTFQDHDEPILQLLQDVQVKFSEADSMVSVLILDFN